MATTNWNAQELQRHQNVAAANNLSFQDKVRVNDHNFEAAIDDIPFLSDKKESARAIAKQLHDQLATVPSPVHPNGTDVQIFTAVRFLFQLALMLRELAECAAKAGKELEKLVAAERERLTVYAGDELSGQLQWCRYHEDGLGYRLRVVAGRRHQSDAKYWIDVQRWLES